VKRETVWDLPAHATVQILAIVLAFTSTPLYTAYPSLTDQQLAAGIMWVPGSLTYFVAAFVCFYHWLDAPPEPRPKELSWT
jgi:cytochrome c oxidase assembly factor CtaG